MPTKSVTAKSIFGRGRIFHLNRHQLKVLHRKIAAQRQADAAATVLPISDPVIAYYFLTEHPVRGYRDTSFMDSLNFHYVRLDPVTHRIETDPARNTASEVWLESGPGYTRPRDGFADVPWHDYHLDSSGPTFDAALVALANRVAKRYGTRDSKRARRARRKG
jgi:hypothetical protein